MRVWKTMTRLAYSLAIALLVNGVVRLAHGSLPEEDRVLSMPGYDGPLPSAMYSGYVESQKEGQGGYHLHYFFVESENDPKNDPLIVWFNGGPGAASIWGLLVELGPFLFSDLSKTASYNKTGVPTPIYNPYGWSKVANVLVTGSPPPVGFSYCDQGGVAGDGYSCGPWNDETTTEINYHFILNWLGSKGSDFLSNDLYVIGESYAGLYVPMVAEQIMNGLQNSSDTGTVKPNFKGFAVGDGCIGTQDIDPAWYTVFNVEFLHGHGQFSDKLYRQIVAECDVSVAEQDRKKRIESGIIQYAQDSKCTDLLSQMKTQVGGYYEYSLYDECTYENGLLMSETATPQASIGRGPHLEMVIDREDNTLVHARKGSAVPSSQELTVAPTNSALNDYPCGGDTMMRIWLNQTVVREALHIDLDNFFFQCDNGVGFNYTSTRKELMPFYQRAIDDPNVRILIYNGDTDPSLNSFYAQNWTAALGIPEKEEWRPWTLDGRQKMGGYVTRYANDFDYLTIRGSGHMVPEYKPAATLEFLTKWLADEDWLPYQNPSK